MTLAELLENEALRQSEFPVTRVGTFLAHAGVCALPRRVMEAMRQHVEGCGEGDQEAGLPAGFFGRTRELAARLLGAAAGEIALVGPTSLALSYVAAGLPWERGDNLVVYFDDYPSNVYPWLALRRRGVQVRCVRAPALGQLEPAEVLAEVDARTRLVALASCHFVSGWRLDHQTLGRALRERNVLFCLDAIQTLGAFPTTVEYVDFLAADAHKWLLGPCGAGILYVRAALQERLAPAVYGWHNVRCPNFTTQEEIVFQPDARRYEAGTANLVGLAGLQAGLELVLEVGVEVIATELRRKRAWLVSALTAKGCVVWHGACPEANASGIVAFHRPTEDTTCLHARLTAAGVVTSLRADRTGQSYIRLSPHFYNTDDELQRVLRAL